MNATTTCQNKVHSQTDFLQYWNTGKKCLHQLICVCLEQTKARRKRFSFCPTGILKQTFVCPSPERCCQEQQGRGIAAHVLTLKHKEQSPLDSVANLHSLNESSLLNGYESAPWKCGFLLMYAYSTNSVITDYCDKWHAQQSKKWKMTKISLKVLDVSYQRFS